MPYRIILSVSGPADRRVQGAQLHAAVLNLLDAVDPALASLVHDAQPSSPFCVAERSLVQPLATCEIGILDDRLIDPFTAALTPGLTLRLGAVTGRIEDVEVFGRPYPDLLASAPADHAWAFTFASPVTFRLPSSSSGIRRVNPLPEPDLVFGSLARRWQRFGGPALPDELTTTISEGLALSYAKLTTKRFVTKPPKVWQLGCTGEVTFTLIGGADRPAEQRRSLSALAMFAAYAGVGDATTKGMGHTLVGPPRRGGRPGTAGG